MNERCAYCLHPTASTLFYGRRWLCSICAEDAGFDPSDGTQGRPPNEEEKQDEDRARP